MSNILTAIHGLSDTIIAFGYIGIFITVFAESGFLLGFFLPGDSLLFTVAILAAKGVFNIYTLVIISIIAAILGDSFGYFVGNRYGNKVFSKKDSFFFKKEYVERTEQYFAKYGKKTIILARFIPIVRTFAPIMAGIGKMDYKTFLSYNVIGGTIWAGGVLGIAYTLGIRFPAIQHYLGYVIVGIIILSLIPVLFELLRKH